MRNMGIATERSEAFILSICDESHICESNTESHKSPDTIQMVALDDVNSFAYVKEFIAYYANK